MNLAPRFKNGAAERVPFGYYSLEASLPLYSSDIADVAVCKGEVTVVVGLTFSYDQALTMPILRGRIVGLAGADAKKTFVRMSAAFAHQSTDSSVGQRGEFALCGFSQGPYTLTVLGERGVLATKLITIPYTGPSLEITVGQDHAVGSFTH